MAHLEVYQHYITVTAPAINHDSIGAPEQTSLKHSLYPSLSHQDIPYPSALLTNVRSMIQENPLFREFFTSLSLAGIRSNYIAAFNSLNCLEFASLLHHRRVQALKSPAITFGLHSLMLRTRLLNISWWDVTAVQIYPTCMFLPYKATCCLTNIIWLVDDMPTSPLHQSKL